MPASRIARRWLPTPDRLAETKGLRWLGHYLQPRPWLWVAHRRRVALGVAVGLAVGVIPLPIQMALAAGLALLLRCNVAAAVAATWLTNPFTMLPIWGIAYGIGRLVIGDGGAAAEPAVLALDWSAPATWWPALQAWMLDMGPVLLVGFPLTGLLMGALAYVCVYVAWWWVIRFERRRRLKARAGRPQS